ncbi:MAG: hypothetical protein ACRC4N_11700 [Gammaproteobacteria bacterium]
MSLIAAVCKFVLISLLTDELTKGEKRKRDAEDEDDDDDDDDEDDE